MSIQRDTVNALSKRIRREDSFEIEPVRGRRTFSSKKQATFPFPGKEKEVNPSFSETKSSQSKDSPISKSRQKSDSFSFAQSKGETVFLSGFKPVLELLQREPERIDTLWIRKGQRSVDTDKLLDLCRTSRVRFVFAESRHLDALCPTGHQGVVARLFEAGFTEFSTLLEQAQDAPLPLILMLDQIQDPGNAGTLARTLYALGGAGLVIPRHNSAYLGAGARRAAAGALEQLPVAKVVNMSRALDEAEAAGFHIYGASLAPESDNALSVPLFTPAVLVLGNEEHGLRLQVAKRCRHKLHIPFSRSFDSLNVAQAGAILVSCFARQHSTNQIKELSNDTNI